MLLHISSAKTAWAGVSTTYDADASCVQGGGLARVLPPPRQRASGAATESLMLTGNRPSVAAIRRIVYAPTANGNVSSAYVEACATTKLR